MKLYNTFLLIIITLFFSIISCVKKDDKIGRINPFDVNGENYYPPVVAVMQDTSVDINDTVSIRATYIDSNGFVESYLWALDGINFNDTISDSILQTTFSTAGIDTLLLKGIDNDGVLSSNTDTIVITVLLKKPIVQAKPKDKVISIGDSLTITASAIDSNGYIKGYFWAKDGVNFSDTLVADSTLSVSYSSQGVKKVLVKAVDDDNISSDVDTVNILVKDNAPLIFFPENMDTISSSIVTVKWHPGFYSHHYTLIIDENPTPSTIISSAIVDTSYILSTQLELSKTYYWKVIGHDGSGKSDTSETWSFTTPDEPDIPIEGLVAYYPFNGNPNDESGNGNDGIEYGGISLTEDRFGNTGSAFNFDGVDDYIEVNNDEQLNPKNGSWTINAWTKIAFTASVNNAFPILSKADGDFDNGYNVHYNVESGEINLGALYETNTGEFCQISKSSNHENQWTMVTFIFNSTLNKLSLWQNSTKLIDTTISIQDSVTPTAKMLIGRYNQTGLSITQYFKGVIDDIRLYNTALSSQEIENLYSEGGYIPPLDQPILKAYGIDSTSVGISWSNISDADNYTLEWSLDSSGTYNQIYSGSDTTYTHTGLSSGQKIWYKVKAKNATQESEWSSTSIVVVDLSDNPYISLFPSAKVFARGKLPDSISVDWSLLKQQGEVELLSSDSFVVWNKNLVNFSSTGVPSSFSVTDLPSTVTLYFAISKDKDIVIGADGPTSDLLTVFGTFYIGPYNNLWEMHWPDGVHFEKNSIGLLGFAYRELQGLSSNSVINNYFESNYYFRNACSFELFHLLGNNVTVLAHAIQIWGKGEGWANEINQYWCNFADPENDGTSERNLEVKYSNVSNSYIYSSIFNDNSNKTWVYLNDTLFNENSNWGFGVKKDFDIFPTTIKLKGEISWSHINPSISITALGDSLTVVSKSENPSLGQTKNPGPDIVIFEPNIWTMTQ